MTPATVPATPAAQPYGAYLPTMREIQIAEMTDFYDRAMFVTGPGHDAVSVIPKGRRVVH